VDRKKTRKPSPFNEGERMLKKIEVCRWLGVTPNTIDSWMRDGHFPKPIVMGDPSRPGSAIRWRKWEIDQWIDGRPREKALSEDEEEHDGDDAYESDGDDEDDS
jgi:predicted DNA-binding transcriptional regulator AlpA